MRTGKILFITNDFPPMKGGQANYFYNLWKRIGGKDCIILAPYARGCGEFDSIGKYKTSYTAKNSFPSSKKCYDDRREEFFCKNVIRKRYFSKSRLARIIFPFFYSLMILRRERIKCVHCGNVLSTGIVGLVFKYLFNIPYVVYTFGADILEFQSAEVLLRWILKKSDKVITISDFTKEKLIEKGVNAEKIIKIYPGVEMGRYESAKSKTGDKRVILTVARLVERKGIDMVIKALPEVKKRVPDILYLIVGCGPMKKKLEKLVIGLGLDNEVVFLGDVPDEDLVGYYNTCDIFVMPSREVKGNVEGFGIVFLEANACGKPVIGGRTGGIKEAVIHEKTGLLVNPYSAEEISNSIIRLLTDSDLAHRLGQNGRKRVEEEFNWDKLDLTWLCEI